MATSNVGFSVTVSGTWTGTMTIEQSGDNQTTWTSAGTTTANTLFTSALTPGITDARVRSSAAMTGTAIITITASGPATIQNITNIGSSSTSNAISPKGTTDTGSSTISLTDAKYAFPGTSQWSCQAGVTNGSAIVTTAANDRPFTGNPVRNAVVGDIVWLANAQCGGENTVIVPVPLLAANTVTTILSIDSAHQIHMATAATGACTVVAQDNCVLIWGPDSDTALQAAWVDAGNSCGTLVLPAGGVMFKNPPNNTTANCPGPAGGNDTGSGLTVYGAGPYSTMLLQRPDGTFGNVMFGDPLGGQRRYFHDFGIASFTAAPAAAATKTGFSVAFQGEVYNLAFLDYWPSTSNSFTALSCSSVTNAIVNCHDNTMLNSGQISLKAGGDQTMIWHNQIQNANNDITITTGRVQLHDNVFSLCGTNSCLNNSSTPATIYSERDVYTGFGTSLPVVAINGGSTFIATDTAIAGTQTTGPGLSCPATAVCFIGGTKSSVFSGAGTANAIANSGTLTLQNTLVASTGGTGLANSATGIVNFLNGNTLSNSLTNASGGVIQGQQANGTYSGACTGVVTSATTVGLYDLGQNTTTTCVTAVVGSGKVMSHTGTVYALFCTATAGNQAADACTVVKNGAAQTMTCSLNAATNCTDGAAGHVITFVAGDILAIEAIAGVATTLANVKGTIVTN